MAVPSHGYRAAFERLSPWLRPWIPIVSLTKGLEPVTHRRLTEVVDELAPGQPAGVPTGPSIAVEVLRGYDAEAVIAMPDEHVSAASADLFRTRVFRRAGRARRPDRDLHQPAQSQPTVGEQLALGRALEEIRAEMRMVAEGVKTCDAVIDLGPHPASASGWLLRRPWWSAS
jgi:glycerol-3-phosphate dehydrogenase